MDSQDGDKPIADMSNVVNLSQETLLNNIVIADKLLQMFLSDAEIVRQLKLQRHVLVQELHLKNKLKPPKPVVVGLETLSLTGQTGVMQ